MKTVLGMLAAALVVAGLYRVTTDRDEAGVVNLAPAKVQRQVEEHHKLQSLVARLAEAGQAMRREGEPLLAGYDDPMPETLLDHRAPTAMP